MKLGINGEDDCDVCLRKPIELGGLCCINLFKTCDKQRDTGGICAKVS